MSPTPVNDSEIADRIHRLDDEYGIEYRESETVQVSSERFAETKAAVRDGYLGSGYVWVVRNPEQTAPLTASMPEDARENRDRVLLILHRGNDEWSIPGGGIEYGETFEDAAVREVDEETGIDCAITGLYGIRVEQLSAPGHDDPIELLRVAFAGEYQDGHIAIQPGELNGAAWFDRPPARIHALAEPIAADWFEP